MFRLADANRDNKLSLREFLFALGHFPDDDDIEREKTKALSKRARKEYERWVGLCIKQSMNIVAINFSRVPFKSQVWINCSCVWLYRMLLIRRTFDRYDKQGVLAIGDFKTALKDLGHDKNVDEALKRAQPADNKGLLYDEYLKVLV